MIETEREVVRWSAAVLAGCLAGAVLGWYLPGWAGWL